jgi:hypothetical protein
MADAQEGSEEAVEPFVNAVTGDVVDAALKLHRLFGLGLLESAYHRCLA